MKKAIAHTLQESLNKIKLNLKEEEIEKMIEIPPSQDMGDYAFPCFFLASKLKIDPSQIALKIRENIVDTTEKFEDIQTSGPYVNFFINRKKIAKDLILEILSKKENYCRKITEKENQIMIEFSQPNTHKAFHVGHIRGTSLGESIARIAEFCGNKVIRANYIGDTGMHVAKWIWCYQKHHIREKLKKDESWIASIYVDAVKRLSKNEKLQQEVNLINQKLATGEDKKLNKLWELTKKFSLKSFEKIYDEMNTHFEVYFFESEMEKQAKKISEELLKKKIAIIDEGATIIDLKKYNLGVWVILRKDGTPLYSIKDIALAKTKFSEYKINESIYLIGAAQSFHMAQLFKTLELMEFPNSENCKFIPFSEVRLPTGQMSSRTGENVLYSDFIKEMKEHTKKEIKKREPKIKKEELEKKALKISMAAIKYSMLKQNPSRNIIFNPKKEINFEGDTGPYILYSYARASSIVKKASKKTLVELELKEIEEKETALILKLNQFKETLEKSFEQLNPSLIANYSYSLAQSFNEFYHECPVIKSEKEEFRLALVESFRQVLKNSLWLLGIDVLEKM